MSKAYYYCKNFSIKEFNNLFAYGLKDPSVLSQKQMLLRLYKATLRKLQMIHVFEVRWPNFDRFYDEAAMIRKDFDAILAEKANEDKIASIQEKYEGFISAHFEAYAAMHPCRPHSNLHGKDLLYSQEALNTDHIGYYSPVPIHGTPSVGHYHEEYPHSVTAWLYDSHFMSDEFDYNDLESEYLNNQPTSQESVKEMLDKEHK